MRKEELKKAWLTAAVISGSIVSAVFFYTLVVEFLSRTSFAPAVSGPAAAALKYAIYITSVAAVFGSRFLTARLDTPGAAPAATARSLQVKAIITAAACEVPAVCGLILFILTRGYWDFYLLAVFSTLAELFNFPRLARWEEKIAAAHGQLQP